MSTNSNFSSETGLIENLPLMAIRGITAFPEIVINFDVERQSSIAAVNAACRRDRQIFLVAQKDILKEKPERDDLYDVGTVCVLRQFIKNPNGGMRIMVEGKYRAKLLKLSNENEYEYDYSRAEVELIQPDHDIKKTPKTEALMRKACELFEKYGEITGNITPEAMIRVTLASNPGYVADFIAQNLFLRHTENQMLLEITDPIKRLNEVNKIISRENSILSMEERISSKLNDQLSKMQKDNILREQLKVIRSELGEDDFYNELDEYREKILALKLSKENEEKLLKEVDRLGKQPFGSSESSVIRSYLDVCVELPWNKSTKERLNVEQTRKILDNDHFGLEKVKDRIIEYLSVKKLAPNSNGTILCLVGPPGVGKTSIAISIARAMGRKLARMSLGGVHDEAEIRGHRKTYIGAMPGRIINAVNQAGTNNPLLLLDEIDKLGSDYRGDPSAALLEVLDPEQNVTFRDHFLEIPFDLSNIFFITTANTTDTIPRPLLDRMEVIELSSYTDEEKLEIAKRHLLPKQRKKHGLNGRQLKISDDAVREIIASYTRESGVRQLERQFASISRKTAAKIVAGEIKSADIKTGMLEDFLGVKKFKPDALAAKNEVGIVNGLAWTSVGGEILPVEVNILDGSGKLELTGNLGDVMKESAKIAISFIRSRTEKLNIEHDFYKTKDIHIHFPEGAIPKDGPSAGITMTVALISALTNTPVRSDVAMTGEVTLRGRILPIGGLKEKTMAALRNGMKTVIIPADNEKDLEEIDQTVRRALNFVTTSHVDSILDIALDFSEAQLGKSFASDSEKPEFNRDIIIKSTDNGKNRTTIRQ